MSATLILLLEDGFRWRRATIRGLDSLFAGRRRNYNAFDHLANVVNEFSEALGRPAGFDRR
jgi:hypothetical protein